MTAALLVAWWALLPTLGPADPLLPTPPPAPPTYVITDNGERIDCTPNYQTCWRSTTP